jgi:hypothetical protein
MRLLKAFLVGAGSLFIIITLFSLLIPFNVRVSRAVLINNAGIGEVYQQIVNFNNWKNWHPIFTKDSANLYWEKPQTAGKDSSCYILHRGQKIVLSLLSADTASVKFLLQSAGENDIKNELHLTSFPSSQSVQVEWRAITKLHWYPWEKFYGIFIDKLSGPGYEDALNGLKEFI